MLHPREDLDLARPEDNDPDSSRVLIVALGASAGGLEACEKFFSHMPEDSGMAFAVVMHLAPDHASALAHLLSRHTGMEVEQAEDNTRVQPNRVYIIPPNATLTIKDSVLRVARPSEPRGRRTPIDSLFASLAEDHAERAVCIMLSGTGTDGTRGLTAIKEHGGMAMAQTLDSAKYDSILRSAISTGLVDHVLRVEEMPAKLLEYAAYLSSLNGNSASLQDQIHPHLGQIHELLRRSTGHDFSQYKESTIARRVDRRMKALQIETVEGYIETMKRQPEEADRLFKDLLIGVTQFFRNPEAFETLKEAVIPKLFEGKHEGDQVRVCVVGCASGEEAYSIAILLSEHAATLESAPRIQIFATDIDERGMEVARKGRYPQGIAEHVTPARLERFFIKQDGGWQVKRELRETCIFSKHSFIKDPPFSRLDLISCRNVMIYLGVDLQQKVIPLFHYALRSGGYLFLGPSESVSAHQDLFRAVDKKHRVFQRRESRVRHAPKFPITEVSRSPQTPEKGRPPEAGNELNLVKQFERIILERYGPACVIVKDNGAAVYFSGPTSRYLRQPAGAPENNVVSLVSDGLRIPLRTALHQAATSRERVVQKQIPVETNDAVTLVDLTVEPLKSFRAELYLIVFKEAASAPREPRGDTGAATGDGSEVTIRNLERELRSAEEQMQTAFEELETTNEELQSANEEYQSTNEELEGSKEELQSFNEELETVNTELSRKVAELDHSNSDLANLLDATQIATIFLDSALRIKNFTPAAGAVFSLIAGDVGRPITDLAARFPEAGLAEDLKRVLETLTVCERQLAAADGRHFQMRILPYRTVHHVIEGVVITFTDVTHLSRSEQVATDARQMAEKLNIELRESERRYREMIDSLPVAIYTTDAAGYLTHFNPAAVELSGRVPVLGTDRWCVSWKIYLGDGTLLPHDECPMAIAIKEGRIVEGAEAMAERPDGTRVWCQPYPTLLRDHEGRVVGGINMLVDITGRKRTEALVAGQKRALEMFTSGTPLIEVLEELARVAEKQSPSGAAVAIHLLDPSGTRFDSTAAPSLPAEYSLATGGLVVSSGFGPGCAAVAARRRVGVADLAASNEFPTFAAFALPLGIRAGWSKPIFGSTGKVLGTVAHYYREPRAPEPAEEILWEILTDTTAIIIERKQADDALRRLNDDLKQFSHAVSHDLQEPLRMVTSYTQLLARRYKNQLGPEADQFIKHALDGAQRMQDLLRDLREYWSVNEQKVDELFPVDCNRVLATALAYLELPIEESGAIVTHDSLPSVMAEELPLTLLFQNLIGNAIKYRRSEAPPRIHVAAEWTPAGCKISVADSGIGIEAKHLEKIFAPFKRLHGPEIPGTGIGLAMCQKIVERYHGRLWVESTHGQGSVFQFTFPGKDGDDQERAVSSVPSA